MIELLPLRHSEIECLRHWRNQQQVRAFMEFQDYIDQDQQERWFRQLNADQERYFIIWNQGSPIGMAHLKDIDAVAGVAQSGLLIGEPRFMGTGIALQASLALLDLAFGNMGLLRVWAKVHRENALALRYNSEIGFQQTGQRGSFALMEMDAATFNQNRDRLQTLAAWV